MRYKKLQINSEKCAKYHYFINYILTNDVDLDNYKDFFFDINFYYTLHLLLEGDEKLKIYSKDMHNKLSIILDYIENNFEMNDIQLFQSIKETNNKIQNINGYELYNNEVILKYDTISSNLKTKPLLWNKSDIDKSFEFDFDAFMSFDLKGLDYEIKEIYTFNYNYLLFIKKFLKMYPEIIIKSKYKYKILEILEYNCEIDKYKNNNSLILGFIKKNYDIHLEMNEGVDRYNQFINLNNDLYNRIINLNSKNCNCNLIIPDYERIYNQATLEQIIILNSKEEIDYTSKDILESLYDLIDYYNEKKLFNAKIKHNVINLMSDFRENMNNLDITKYNDYLIKVNSSPENENAYINEYIDNKLGINAHLKLKEKYIITEFMETLYLDGIFLESLLSDNYEEDYLKHFVYNDDYVETINRYLIEYPSLFYNKEIHDRIEQTFTAIIEEYNKDNLSSKEKYKQNLKTLKKINKMYYGKR